jgi:hypothetical protein
MSKLPRGLMNTRTLLAALLLLAVCGRGRAQLSGYSSVGFGYQQNPLSTYERLSDQVKQGYLELDYERELPHSSFGLQYIGGLMIFNRFEGRNFYEHSLFGVYKLQFDGENESGSTADSSPTGKSDTRTKTHSEEEDQEEEKQSVGDSTAAHMDLGAKLIARHDKLAYDEFDNQALALSASYRTPLGEHLYGRIGNTFTLRSYPNVTTLSNFNNLLAAEIGVTSETNLVYGFILSSGLKYYATSTYDTTRFEGSGGPAPVSPGKGKASGNKPGSSEKQILLQPQENGTVQFLGSLFLRKDWPPKTSFLSSLAYRWTARSAARYLAQQASASLVGDDIYNDFFSYEGPELRMRLTSTLISKIQVILEGGLQHRRFAAPALSLSGEELASHRTDLRTSIELFVSRYFALLNGVGVDVFVDADFVRNQSNDSYNDFSGSSISAGLGISF